MRFEFSAGGIVFRKTKDNFEVLVCQHSQHHGWGFPKGIMGDRVKGEGKSETALREVKEETGVAAKILKPLTEITYWYVFEGEKIKKRVHYFLMEYQSGDIENRDQEMEKVEWLPVSEVEERLSYKGDKKVWEEAKNLIASS